MSKPESLSASGALVCSVDQHLPMPLHGSLECAPGQLLALVGPSGAGKTSFLRCLAGLMKPAQGHVAVGGEVWLDTARGLHVPARQRNVGLVFQNYALMPHLSAQANVELALLELPKPARQQQASQWLHNLRLGVELHGRRPAQLSGGQQQRVALARALARSPKLLLLDEPFSAVDQMNRQSLYELLADLRQQHHIPIVLVTHDLQEARQLADKLVVLDAGQVLQAGTPAEIYRSPRNARVADLLGVQNRFSGVWLGPQNEQDRAQGVGVLKWTLPVQHAGGGAPSAELPILRVRDKKRLKPGQAVTWVVQGDGLMLEGELRDKALDHAVQLHTTVQQVRNLGETTAARLALSAQPDLVLRLSRAGPGRERLQAGQMLQLWLDCSWVHVMPVKG